MYLMYELDEEFSEYMDEMLAAIKRNRQPEQRAKKWAEINLGSNPVFGSSQWIAVSYCELLCGEILSVTMKYSGWEAVT